jgi:hypothetical protein
LYTTTIIYTVTISSYDWYYAHTITYPWDSHDYAHCYTFINVSFRISTWYYAHADNRIHTYILDKYITR